MLAGSLTGLLFRCDWSLAQNVWQASWARPSKTIHTCWKCWAWAVDCLKQLTCQWFHFVSGAGTPGKDSCLLLINHWVEVWDPLNLREAILLTLMYSCLYAVTAAFRGGEHFITSVHTTFCNSKPSIDVIIMISIIDTSQSALTWTIVLLPGISDLWWLCAA